MEATFHILKFLNNVSFIFIHMNTIFLVILKLFIYLEPNNK